ncbi:unnamed protein product [Soboliphyme baturini]|uniref:Transcription initiation factor TFIID 150 kDa subunit n=1 Tax=Soboliphyme baturini TaxID=241478 RepID=A0A183J626_9BILA|nr:unnamed protein product [Soboliphyme baturini]
MDLSALDPDSPVLWLWLDPDMVTISSIDVQQPDYQWQYQVRYERNVIAQLEALHVLPNFCSLQTHVAILDVIENEQYYYRVRCAACHCLAKVANKLITALTGPPALILLFRKMFGSKSCATIPRQNNFSNLQQYFVMLAIISSIAELRGPNGKCLMDTCIFLLDLLKYNDNSQNKYSDDCYRATLVDALGRVVGMPESASFLHFFQSPTASASDLFEGGAGGVPEVASNLVRRMLNTLLTQLSLDVLRPSYGRVVTWKCLEALMQFYISRVITCDFEIWLKFAACGNFSATRVRAAGCLVRLLKVTKDVGLFSKLLDLLDDKHDTAFRYRVIRLLCDHPPFTPKERVGNPLYCKDTFDRLCSMFIDIGPFADFWFHGALLDFIFLTFDRDRQLFLNLTSIHPPEAMLNRSAIAVTNESTL